MSKSIVHAPSLRDITEAGTEASSVKPKTVKRPKPARGEAWGILNPWGDFWTYETFGNEAAAVAYIENFWRGFPGTSPDLRRFKVVRAKITVSAK